MKHEISLTEYIREIERFPRIAIDVLQELGYKITPINLQRVKERGT